ncbi:hypothetical protein [Flammeovirga agarivorans]|uniref:DUF3828 domain-containing protein n=1 Tax=Flammeovirga agarivorans TaxID=2726742 RepID=A0A7X8SRG1_9BACT|nr:hypothetical protein [Flammeovirga agarivorans]NLR95023.1 hypothetical protein [Flammeovirga agarivorans]
MSKIFLSIFISLNIFTIQQPKDTVLEFYDWYINKGGQNILNIIYVEKENGMTGLNLIEIENELTKSGFFTQELITTYIASFANCNEKLTHLKYSDYLKIEDIFDLEELACGVQYPYWIGDSMEDPKVFKAEKMVKLDSTTEHVTIFFPDALLRLNVELKYQNKKWLINSIK